VTKVFAPISVKALRREQCFPPQAMQTGQPWPAGRLAIQAGAAAKQPGTRDIASSSLTSLLASSREENLTSSKLDREEKKKK